MKPLNATCLLDSVLDRINASFPVVGQTRANFPDRRTAESVCRVLNIIQTAKTKRYANCSSPALHVDTAYLQGFTCFVMSKQGAVKKPSLKNPETGAVWFLRADLVNYARLLTGWDWDAASIPRSAKDE